MTVENIGQECRLKKIDEKRNYFIKEIKRYKLISKKQKTDEKGNYFIKEIKQYKLISKKHKKVYKIKLF